MRPHEEIESFGSSGSSIPLSEGSFLGGDGFRAMMFRIHVSEFSSEKDEL